MILRKKTGTINQMGREVFLIVDIVTDREHKIIKLMANIVFGK